MIDTQQLRNICKKYAGQQSYFSGDIPLNKLQNAKQSLKISGREDIFALIDCTVFGSAKDSIAIAATGIYAKNIGQPTPTYISWDELRDLTIINAKRKIQAVDLTFSNGKTISGVGSSMGHDLGILQLVTDLIDAASVPDEPLEWFVVTNGQQHGPLTQTAVMRMAADKTILESTPVWRDGMSGWTSLRDVPALNPVPQAPAPPPFVAPPPAPPPLPGAAEPNAWVQAQGALHQTPAGQQTVAAHTTRQGAPLVDINSAEVNALLTLPWMTLGSAQAIESERRNRLGFTKVEEVGRFLGLQPHQVEGLRPLVCFSAFSVRGGVSPTGKRLIDF